MGPRASLHDLEKTKISCPNWDSNPTSPSLYNRLIRYIIPRDMKITKNSGNDNWSPGMDLNPELQQNERGLFPTCSSGFM